MQIIPLETWARRPLFDIYSSLDFPHFSLTVDVDVTGFLAALKAADQPVFPMIVYAVAKAANEIPELRTRIRGEQVVLHEVAAPSFTVPWRDGLINYCAVTFEEDRVRFLERCLREMAAAQAAEAIAQVGGTRDDVLYMTCYPWGGFTGMTHPIRRDDSIPRFAWGRISPKEGREVLPFNVQFHHGLADGVHAARFFARLEEVCREIALDLGQFAKAPRRA